VRVGGVDVLASAAGAGTGAGGCGCVGAACGTDAGAEVAGSEGTSGRDWAA